MREFANLIQDLELVDLPLENQRYTWARTNAASRIDRVIVTRAWITNFLGLKTICADRSLSDHWPVILHSHREESRVPAYSSYLSQDDAARMDAPRRIASRTKIEGYQKALEEME